MATTLQTHLDALQKALHTLSPSGSKGFEGLLAEVLGTICEQPFRLATSGTQRGRDGDSAFDNGATYFEGKRYNNDVPKKDVVMKLADLKADDAGQVDTWIMAATSEVPALYAKDFRRIADADGIGIVVLDWTDSSLPPLAVAVAMAATSAKAFLTAHLVIPAHATILKEGLDAIDAVGADPAFPAISASLKATLRDPSTGLGLAKSANRTWLDAVFASRIRARQQFGQPVAPNDPDAPPTKLRTELRDRLLPAFQGAPMEKTYVVLGLEGAGKTWLVATTWLSASPASLLVFIPAGELLNPQDIQDFEGLLIRRLIAQTGAVLTEANKNRWRRRFAGWRANPDPANVRLAVCIDGLNQNPAFPWSRFIDPATLLLAELGGQLIVTTRTPHFPSFRDAIAQESVRIQVTEWAKAELDVILKARGIDPDGLAASVFTRLRNPRILDIALKLLDEKAIQTVDELTIGRLLFEHMLHAQQSGVATLSPSQFAKTLSELGSQYLARRRDGQSDDLKLFDTRLDERLAEVASSSFFVAVGDDPDQYEISDDGLHLALALSLIAALETEVRHGRDPGAKLEEVLEPVAALDMTADIVASAIEVVCLRDPCPEAVASALIRHYAGLQNPPANRTEAIQVLVGKAPAAFVAALKELALSSQRAGTDWLAATILAARSDPGVRAVVKKAASEWLTWYSLAPERMMHLTAGRDPVEKVSEDRERVLKEITERLDNLTANERTYLEISLVRKDELDLDGLHRLALYLLAGTPLSDVAPSLLAFAFGTALNASIRSPHDDFNHLISFNHSDWLETKNSLGKMLLKLPEPRSRVGKWAAVSVLRASGGLSEAIMARLIYEDLTKDQERFEGFSLKEKYCQTDPCDPTSVRPANIDATAEAYRNLEVDKLRLLMGSTKDDHFVEIAMPGIARFAPEAGVEMLRRFAQDAAGRSGLPRRQAVLSLLKNSVLLERPVIDALIERALDSSADHDTKDAERRDEWLISQYSLLIAMPHLTAAEQLDLLERVQSSSIFLSLMDELKEPDAALVETALERAFVEKDIGKQIRLLGAVKHAGYTLTVRAKEIVGDLTASLDKTVRAQAIGIIADMPDNELLKRFVKSGWDASALNPNDHYFEIWYGSGALIAAANAGLIDIDRALGRMAISHYGFAAESLGSKAMSAITDRITLALRRVLDLPEISEIPEMERPEPISAYATPPMVNILDEQTPKDMKAAFDRLHETNQQFQDRQERLHEAYQRFRRELTGADAQLVLADLTFGGLVAIHVANPDVVESWQKLLMEADTRKKRGLHIFAVQLANAIAHHAPDKAAALIEAYANVQPFVRHVIGNAKIPADVWAIWSNADVPVIRKICFRLMDEASTDATLAAHVIAAFKAEQSAALKEYTSQLTASGEPARIARAIMIAGLSDRSDFADEILTEYQDAPGFIGKAYKAARFAYDRNQWARHWFLEMKHAATAVDFWRYSVLFRKVVDARFDLWAHEEKTRGPFMDAFYPTIDAEVRNRIKHWNDRRRSKLFGAQPPEQVFLEHDLAA